MKTQGTTKRQVTKTNRTASAIASHKNAKNAKVKPRDFTKISFNGEQFGKGRLVLAIVNQYVKDHPTVTYSKLKEVFPDSLHSLGIVRPISSAKKASAGHKRFFIDNVIKLKDKAVAVCSDFGKNNIGKFMDRANELGYQVKLAS